jgi:NAD(P)-dependent dehydrogenase (short-subunit alcohol dehydrogenase family)
MGRSLAGKVALVTGASQGGTGRSVAVRFAAEGAKVAITARSADGLRETMAVIEAFGGTAMMMPCDLGDPNGGRGTLIARAGEAFGPVDILVNNAVTHDIKPVEKWTLADMEHHAQVNLWAPWLMMADVIPDMKARGRGWILNLSSSCAELPPGPPFGSMAKDTGALYGVMKAGINRLTVAAAAELEAFGVAVNALSPQSSILTEAVKASGQVPDLSVCEPVETMAEAALALCSGNPKTLTGRLAYSLQLLLELNRATKDLRGERELDGWRPENLVAEIRKREVFFSSIAGSDSFDFHRPHTPYPKALQGRDG